jgi:hypothetical protein
MMLEQTALSANFNKREQQVFAGLNAVVEPAVRKGFGSPVLAPAGLIVLETVGFKSGARRLRLCHPCSRQTLIRAQRGCR